MAKIGLDAGHYPGDCRVSKEFAGQLGTRDEYTLNLKVYGAVEKILKAAGHTVVDIGQRQQSVVVRAQTAKEKKCDIAVSIHHNAGRGRGATLYRHKNGVKGKESKALQEALYAHLAKINKGNRSNPIGTAELGIIRCDITGCPAVLIECAFMDNQTDVDLILSPGYYDKMGRAIADGINSYLGAGAATVPDIIPPQKPKAELVSDVRAICGTVEILTTINVRNAYSFADSAVVGQTHKGERHQVVESAVVEGTTMYRMANGKFVTGSAAYVTFRPGIDKKLTCSVHCQTYGNIPAVPNGCVAGTVGEAKRLEALTLESSVPLEYRAHCQTYGWQDWKTNGQMAGTTGIGKRLEAVQIRRKDGGKVRYRVHMQGIGWGEWATDGDMAGTEGQARRVEAVQVEMV